MPGTISQYQVVISGQLITASLWNGMELNIINLGLIPSGIDDYSATDPEMQTQVDPFPAGATSRPTSLQGELERLRFQFDNVIGKTYWYEDPDVDIATFKTRFDAHTHDGTANQGPKLGTAAINDSAITTALINDSAITAAKLADSSVETLKLNNLAVTTGKIAAAAVDETKLAASVAGNGLAGGAGTALSVNVDASTIEISADTLRLKDAGITVAKLAQEVLDRMSPKTIQKFSTAVTVNLGSDASATVQGTANQAITAISATTKGIVIVNGARITAQSNVGITSIIASARITTTTNVAVAVSCSPDSVPGNNSITVTVDFEVVEFN